MPTYNTYEDYVNGSQVDINETSKNAMYERGKYLVEYIDKIPNKLTGNDFKGLLAKSNKSKRMVCTYGPGSGKTTALRQYIVSMIGSYLKNGVVSIQLIDDIHKFVYDVKSHLTYLGKKVNDDMIRAYTSSDKLSYRDLLGTGWIVCSHQRLLIEPSSTLYYVSSNLASSAMMMPKPRDILIIDEMPSNMFIGRDASDLQILLSLDEYLIATMSDESDDEDLAKADLPLSDQDRTWILTYMVKNGIRNTASKIIQRYVPRLSENMSYNNIIRNKNKMTSNQYDIEIARLCEFTNYFIHKVRTWYDSHDSFERLTPVRMYYTPLLFNIDKVLILDGTGDILFDHSGWDLIKDDRFKRQLNIDQVSLVDSKVSRYQDLDHIVKSYVDVLSQISNKYDKDTQILGYIWKTKKNKIYEDYDSYSNDKKQEVEIVTLIEDELSKRDIHNVELITYKSGKEKSSNEFIKSSVAVILGKFVLPDEYISDFSNSNNIVPRLESLSFTETLLIQFMYRTRARSGKPIDLYIDEQYTDILEDLLIRVGVDWEAKAGDEIYCEVPELQNKKSGPKGPNSMTPEEEIQRGNLLKLATGRNYTIDDLNQTMNTDLRSDKIYSKLNKFGIEYEKIGKGRGLKINLL